MKKIKTDFVCKMCSHTVILPCYIDGLIELCDTCQNIYEKRIGRAVVDLVQLVTNLLAYRSKK